MQDNLPTEMDLIAGTAEVVGRIVEEQMRMINEIRALKPE